MQTLARTTLSALNLEVVAVYAALSQGADAGEGDRPPPSLAAEPVDLVELREPRVKDGKPSVEVLTLPGRRTAVRRVPPSLSKLSREDGRFLAVVAYATAVERTSSIKGVSIEPALARASSSSVPDGGASTKALQAATIRLARGTINRWKWSRARRNFVTGSDRVILETRRGSAKPITATDLLDGVAIEGLDMTTILRRRGWSGHSSQRKILSEAFDDMLASLADALGYGNRLRRS
ncbi:MAG: hypothetical protein AAF982_02570 [Pseudomonadota bacterium]